MAQAKLGRFRLLLPHQQRNFRPLMLSSAVEAPADLSDPWLILSAYLAALDDAKMGSEPAKKEAAALLQLLRHSIKKVHLSWAAERTKRNTIKARGEGEHQGRMLYGEAAQRALGMRARHREDRQHRANKAIEIVRKIYAQKPLDDSDIQQFADNASAMTVAQLRHARGILAARFGGARQQAGMVNALREHVRGQTAQWAEREAKANEVLPVRESRPPGNIVPKKTATLADLIERDNARAAAIGRPKEEKPEPTKEPHETPLRDYFGIAPHKEMVARAIAEGKEVSHEVLKDYPDLVKEEPQAVEVPTGNAERVPVDEAIKRREEEFAASPFHVKMNAAIAEAIEGDKKKSSEKADKDIDKSSGNADNAPVEETKPQPEKKMEETEIKPDVDMDAPGITKRTPRTSANGKLHFELVGSKKNAPRYLGTENLDSITGKVIRVDGKLYKATGTGSEYRTNGSMARRLYITPIGNHPSSPTAAAVNPTSSPTTKRITRTSGSKHGAYQHGQAVKQNGQWHIVDAANSRLDDQGSWVHNATVRPATAQEAEKADVDSAKAKVEKGLAGRIAGPDDDRSRPEFDRETARLLREREELNSGDRDRVAAVLKSHAATEEAEAARQAESKKKYEAEEATRRAEMIHRREEEEAKRAAERPAKVEAAKMLLTQTEVAARLRDKMTGTLMKEELRSDPITRPVEQAIRDGLLSEDEVRDYIFNMRKK